MKKRRTFSAEYRRDALRLVLEQGYSQAEAARSPGNRLHSDQLLGAGF